jgi:hypothetical protein
LKDRHSGLLLSWSLSEITIPQLLQMISPDSGSAMIVLLSLLHIEHVTIAVEGDEDGTISCCLANYAYSSQ